MAVGCICCPIVLCASSAALKLSLEAMSTPALAHLATFSTCEISDALIKLGVPHGGHIPDIHLISSGSSLNTRICAPAYTVQMVLSSNQSAPKLSSHFVDMVPAGYIVVIDAPPRLVSFPSFRLISAYSALSVHLLLLYFLCSKTVQRQKMQSGVA